MQISCDLPITPSLISNVVVIPRVVSKYLMSYNGSTTLPRIQIGKKNRSENTNLPITKPRTNNADPNTINFLNVPIFTNSN